MNRLGLYLGVLILAGCASQPEAEPAVNQPPMVSSTLDKPLETMLDEKLKLADLVKEASLKPFPGAEEANVQVLKRADDGYKFVSSFTTSKSIVQVLDFYKAEGLDIKIVDKVGTAMGMTKSNASVIVEARAEGSKSEVKVTAISYQKRS